MASTDETRAVLESLRRAFETGEIDGALAIEVGHARITGLYYVRNPDKLTRLESTTPLTRR